MKDRLGRRLLEWRIRMVLPHVRGRLLDIGCGTNELVRAYAGEGTGVDVYPWDGANLVVENTARLPFPDQTFDTVTIIAALNHIPNRDEVLREADRILKPDGRFVMTMIPPRISRVWHFLRKPWDSDQHERGMIEGELYGLTTRHVHRLLTEAGFRITETRYFMCGLNCLTVARKA